MWIKLSSWLGDKAPGEVVEVTEAAAKALARDGLVAEVVVDAPVPPAVAAEEPEAAAPEPVRRRR